MKYEVILNYIKSQISNKKIKPGEKLPSIRDICDKFECSKITASKVYRILEKEHLVYSIPKSGHYLIENSLSDESNFEDYSIDFSTSAPDERILPYEEFEHCLNQTMELYKRSLFLHSDTHGLENLIYTIRKQLQNYQIFTEDRCIFITTGSQQAINILSMMKFPNGKVNVLVEQPTYYGALESLKLNNINVIGINRNKNGLNFNELENIFKDDNIKFFYTIPRFHNPSGFSYSKAQREIILKLAQKYDVYVVEDDYLGDLEIQKKSDPLYAMDVSDRVIYLKSYSKILIPGLRVSAVVLPKVLLNLFEKYKKWNDLSTSILSQGALEIYIRSGMFDEHIKKLKKVYFERMSYLGNLVKSLSSSKIKWNIPRSGFFASFRINQDFMNYNEFIKRLSMRNVYISDPNMFYLADYKDKKLIRLSLSRADNNQIKKGINIILDEICK